MALLRVFLFGQVRILHADQPSPLKIPPAGQALLAYLLLQRHRSHPRELLAGLFWGDHSQERARSCLNTALWRLRRLLEPEAAEGSFLLATLAEVGFNHESDYWLDVADFEAQTSQVTAIPASTMTAGDAQRLEEALRLYTGELLEGHYDDWALRERERLRRLYLNSLAHLMGYYKHRHACQEALACGQRILDQDPLREEIHRDMMRLYLENGQRALAVRQYELCREWLRRELGISPMTETQQLSAQIVQESDVSPAPAGSSQELVQQLRLALQGFNQAQQQLLQAIQVAERFLAGHKQQRPRSDSSPALPTSTSHPSSRP